MEAKINWKGNLSFDGQADSGYSLPLGASSAVGGESDGFRPMELFAIGLAGCTGMDVISILSKKRQDVTDFEVQVHAERAEEHPKVFTRATIEYFVSGHGVKEDAVTRSIQLSAERYCPAQAMLGEIIPIALKYHIYEDQEDGDKKLVTSGEFTPA
jgi:putative redox protein